MHNKLRMSILSVLFFDGPLAVGYICLEYLNELDEEFEEFPYQSLYILYIAFCCCGLDSLFQFEIIPPFDFC